MDIIKEEYGGRFHIITASETWLNTDTSSQSLEIRGYSGPYRLDREHGRCGGLIAWVVDSLAVKRRPNLESDDLEAMCLEIKSKHSKLLLIVTYRQDDGYYTDKYWDELQSLHDKIPLTLRHRVLFTGDFNADGQTNTNGARDYPTSCKPTT